MSDPLTPNLVLPPKPNGTHLCDNESRIAALESRLKEAEELLSAIHDDPNVGHLSDGTQQRLGVFIAFLRGAK